jgi:hypothetical protein
MPGRCTRSGRQTAERAHSVKLDNGRSGSPSLRAPGDATNRKGERECPSKTERDREVEVEVEVEGVGEDGGQAKVASAFVPNAAIMSPTNAAGRAPTRPVRTAGFACSVGEASQRLSQR